MKLLKTSVYKKDVQKKIINKHLQREFERIESNEELLKQSNDMKELMFNPLARVYCIEKKSGPLKEIYTANINQKLRMYIKPLILVR